MTLEDFAKKLNGCEYGNEVSAELRQEAKELGFVIVYGYSDDLIEFDGAMDQEVGLGDGKMWIRDGQLSSNPDKLGWELSAEFCPLNDKGEMYADWLIKTEMPSSSFEVMENKNLYCVGLVFSLADSKTKTA